MDIITRQEAKAQGLTRYFTGLECKRGHVSERRVVNRSCYACHLEHTQTIGAKAKNAARQRRLEYKTGRKVYRESNSVDIAAKRAAYRLANTEKIAAKNATYYAENAEKLKAQQAEYGRANAEKIAAYVKANRPMYNAHGAARRATQLQATPPWVDLKTIKAIYKQCAERTKTTGIKHAVDHVYPLISDEVCGLHVAANLQILTKSENSRKHNRMPAPEQVPSDLE